MRVLICYDWLDSAGGAERLLSELIRLFPEAVIATLMSSSGSSLVLRRRLVWQSMLVLVPFLGQKRFVQTLLGNWLWRRVDFNWYDLVISVTSDQAKAVRHSRQICICLTPPRHLWELFHYYIGENSTSWVVRCGLALVATPLRILDVESARKCRAILAISEEISTRVQRAYGLQVKIIYPSVSRIRI